MIDYTCDKGHRNHTGKGDFKNGCPSCNLYKKSSKYTKYTYEDIENQCISKNLEWINKEDFRNLELDRQMRNTIQVKCNICNNISKINVTHLFSDRKCGGCTNSIGKSDEEYRSFFYDKFDCEEYELISKYKTSKDDVVILHKKCGKSFNLVAERIYGVSYTNLCPKCYPRYKHENYIKELLIKLNIEFKTQYSFSDLKGDGDVCLRFDFAIFEKGELKCLLEYDGEMHYIETTLGNDLNKQIKYDKLKDDYCKKHNIKLIRIPYWEFDNSESILRRELL